MNGATETDRPAAGRNGRNLPHHHPSLNPHHAPLTFAGRVGDVSCSTRKHPCKRRPSRSHPSSNGLAAAAAGWLAATATSTFPLQFPLYTCSSSSINQHSKMNAGPEGQVILSSSSSSSSSSYMFESEADELQGLALTPRPWNTRKMLSKQLSMCETPRDVAWERRRRQILRQERKREAITETEDLTALTDEDLHELKGCIELGFGFNEEEGQRLCNTLPALDLYFAVNRQLSVSPVSTPHTSSASSLPLDGSLGGRSSSFGSTRSEESWKICSPGDNPQQVKMKLRHWAQAVACSVMQSH